MTQHSNRLDDVESRVVWILGGPRTGSTWLMELLAWPLAATTKTRSGSESRPIQSQSRPYAVPINEPYLGVHLAPVMVSGETGVFTAAEAREVFGGPDPSYFFHEGYADAWRPQLRSLILSRLAAQGEVAAREHGLDSPFLVVKEPNGTEAAPLLGSTLPGSRILFLLRDGRDVLDSLLDAVSPGGWLEGADTAKVASSGGRLEFLRTNAIAWLYRVNAVQKALEAHPPELTHTVRYEDLRADTHTGLREITAWLGADPGEAALEEAVSALSYEAAPAEGKGRGKSLRFASPGRWRESMGRKEQKAVLELIGPKLTELGYQT
jgi:Sulfotransferase family